MNHDTYLNSYLADILATAKNVAVVGASTDDKRPSHWISGFLLGKGYHVFPVNPLHRGGRILGQHVYGSLAEIPEPIHLVDVFRRSEHLDRIVDEVLALSPRPGRDLVPARHQGRCGSRTGGSLRHQGGHEPGAGLGIPSGLRAPARTFRPRARRLSATGGVRTG